MIKNSFTKDGNTITSYAFKKFGKKWIVAFSGKKWHAGEKFKKAPIWFSTIGKDVPAVFIWKMAIGFQKNKKNGVEEK